MYNFYEFFAGGGMARAGLGDQWNCLFANDFDHKKGRIYRRNWGGDTLKIDDIKNLSPADLPGQSDVAWASFPCQDLSLAGGGAGLKGDRSGTFWPFWALMKSLVVEGRAPNIIVLENVCGTLSSHGGEDFNALCTAFVKEGYLCGAVVVDAALFVPQSRPRLFVIGVRRDQTIPKHLISPAPAAPFHNAALRLAYHRLPVEGKQNWVWWALPEPTRHKRQISDLIESNPTGVNWHTPEETQRLISMMSDINLRKVKQARDSGKRLVGTVYKRTRANADGLKIQRAEVRFDSKAGCLRTPSGGSSRQIIVIVEGHSIKSRLISGRETARLMGLPDTYILPENYNETYHLTGDGVVVPVVRHLASSILEPLLDSQPVYLEVAA